ETVSASLMTVSNVADTQLRFSLRSNEVLGTPRVVAPAESPIRLLFNALLSALTAALALFTLTLYLRQKRGISTIFFSDTPANVRYIALLSGVPLPRNVLSGERELTYIGAGDLFLGVAFRGDPNVRKQCVLALKALLAADTGTAPASIAAIRANLEMLDCPLSDEEFISLRDQAKKSRNVLEWRRRMAAFLMPSK